MTDPDSRGTEDDPGEADRIAVATERTAAVFDRSAADYERVGVDFFTPFGRRLVQVAQVAEGERVLDVGCGSGAVLVPAAEAVGETGSVLGVDLADAMLDRCRAAIEGSGLHWAAVRHGNAAEPGVPGSSVDVVLAGLVLFFLPRPDLALAAHRRALRPGGRLAVSTFGPEDPAFAGVYSTIAAHVPEPPPGTDPPRRARDNPFTRASFVTGMLTDAGFDGIEHVEDRVPVRFEDPGQWIRWSWSHGGRALWEAIPEEGRGAARDEVLEVLGSMTGADGSLVHPFLLRYTVARRA